ncbi:hypothetical protein [Desertivirga xinjiangensis]|uniref:hypothetical protein n=1 Tax=Desertivirga xinjiangensis TaxID=539206 RepID=UPI00210ED365|nr:hypothetical protein [Pedobacter xinjiangensis]
MKYLLILPAFCLLSFISVAQRNFYHLSAGLGGGITQNQGDLNSPEAKSLLTGSVDYYFSPYINTGIELQFGKLYGQETKSYYRFYQNHYKSALLITKVHMGQFITSRRIPVGNKAHLMNVFKGIYAGTGIGFIANHQKGIYREEQNRTTGGSNKNNDVIIPFTFGIDNSASNSRFITGIGYQAHFAMNDQIDGYYGSENRGDFYSTLVVSLKMKFGPLGIF